MPKRNITLSVPRRPKAGRTEFLLAVLVLCCSCAVAPVKVDLPIDHPASPEAAGTSFEPPPNPFAESAPETPRAAGSETMTHGEHASMAEPPEVASGDLGSLLGAGGLADLEQRLDPAAEVAVGETVETLLGRELTPEAAAEVALLNNPSLRAELESLGIARAEVARASRLANPVLVGGPRFSDRSGTQLDLGIVQNLLQLLVRPARKQLADAQLEEARLEVACRVLELAAHTRQDYFEVVGAKQIREMRGLVVDAAESAYELARRMREAGNLSDLDLAVARVFYEEARIEAGRSEVELLEARERLTRRMGLWGEQVHWTVSDRLPDPPLEEPPLERLEALAVANRLDLAAKIRSVEVAAAALGIARDWRYLLTAEIGVSAERETDGEWLVGPSLALELPIFDRHQAVIAEHRARLRGRTAEMLALAVEIRSEVRTLRDRLLMSRDLLKHYREVVIPLRERIVSLTEEQYNYMLVGAFDLLSAKQSEHEAYRDYLEAVRDYWVRRIELERAVGGELETARNVEAASGRNHGEPR